MKKIIIAILLCSPIVTQAQKVSSLTETIELRMPSKNYGGSNGAAVAYNSEEGKYYACFAGNTSYPLAVFNEAGKRLSRKSLSCKVDSRGLWYNENTNSICGKGHNNSSWYRYKLNDDGIPTSVKTYTKMSSTSNNQTVAAYNDRDDEVYLLSKKTVKVYYEDGKVDDDEALRLYPGITKRRDLENDRGSSLDDEYNTNVVVYTGMRKAEFGLLNYRKKQIELYNKRNGLLTKILKLPKSVRTYDMFNFSYANGIFCSTIKTYDLGLGLNKAGL